MTSYTRYICASRITEKEFSISIEKAPINPKIKESLKSKIQLLYSPIFPAYLSPNLEQPSIPQKITSICFVFAQNPYNMLGKIKPFLKLTEQNNVYFSQGLASLIFINSRIDNVVKILGEADKTPIEYWPIQNSIVNINHVKIININYFQDTTSNIEIHEVKDKELLVYAEQIYASLVTLMYMYNTYFPEEIKTIEQISKFLIVLFDRYETILYHEQAEIHQKLLQQKQRNAIISALVEISASLSYAVTQGTSGCAPILQNHSPFPHHSLLGVGGATRSLTKLTRYFESAFTLRSASNVIREQYSSKKVTFNVKVSKYDSGPEYELSTDKSISTEEFDKGGDFRLVDSVPLVTYFSLRHGFKESKFSVTAASECLTDGLSPQWTLITLSHEIMHSRVREIFQALFGIEWETTSNQIISQEFYDIFRNIYEQPEESTLQINISDILKYVIIYFCLAMDRSSEIKNSPSNLEDLDIHSLSTLEASFHNYKLFAIELLVHFHDYYFTYACQSKIYAISLWASWIKVAAPIKKPEEYLIRTLATLACGSGLKSRAAFQQAIDIFLEALDILETNGIKSPIFISLKDTLKNENTKESIFIKFKFSYYLIDQIRRYFASKIIAEKIDRLDKDPFAEGTISSEDYSSSIFIYGDEKNSISPVRYLLSSITKSFISPLQIEDFQWLSAWNTLIISSQEVQNDYN